MSTTSVCSTPSSTRTRRRRSNAPRPRSDSTRSRADQSEDIKVYLERFQEAFSATYPNEEIHSEKAFGVLFRSLSPDFQREHSNLKFAPYDIDEDDERVRREYRGNVIVSSTPQFHGIIRAFYKRRNPATCKTRS